MSSKIISINHSTELVQKTNPIDMNKSESISIDLDWICFQLSESVFHWLILYLVVEILYGFEF